MTKGTITNAVSLGLFVFVVLLCFFLVCSFMVLIFWLDVKENSKCLDMILDPTSDYLLLLFPSFLKVIRIQDSNKKNFFQNKKSELDQAFLVANSFDLDVNFLLKSFGKQPQKESLTSVAFAPQGSVFLVTVADSVFYYDLLQGPLKEVCCLIDGCVVLFVLTPFFFER
jgi:glucan phosphoethanolaminetransferase (alkaline phosphatase superfamily)